MQHAPPPSATVRSLSPLRLEPGRADEQLQRVITHRTARSRSLAQTHAPVVFPTATVAAAAAAAVLSGPADLPVPSVALQPVGRTPEPAAQPACICHCQGAAMGNKKERCRCAGPGKLGALQLLRSVDSAIPPPAAGEVVDCCLSAMPPSTPGRLKKHLLVSVDSASLAAAVAAAQQSPSRLQERRGATVSQAAAADSAALQSPLMFHLELMTPQPSPTPSPPVVNSSCRGDGSGTDSGDSSASLDSVPAVGSGRRDFGARSNSDVSDAFSARSSVFGGWGPSSYSAATAAAGGGGHSHASSSSTALNSALPGASPLSSLDAAATAAAAAGSTADFRSTPPRTRSCVLPVAVKTNFDGLGRRSGGAGASGPSSDLATYRTLQQQRQHRTYSGASSRTLPASTLTAALSAGTPEGAQPTSTATTAVATSCSQTLQAVQQQLLSAAAAVAPSAKDAQALQWRALQAQHFPPPPPLPALQPHRPADSYSLTAHLPTRTLAKTAATSSSSSAAAAAASSSFTSPASIPGSANLRTEATEWQERMRAQGAQQQRQSCADPLLLDAPWESKDVSALDSAWYPAVASSLKHGRGRSAAEQELSDWERKQQLARIHADANAALGGGSAPDAADKSSSRSSGRHARRSAAERRDADDEVELFEMEL